MRRDVLGFIAEVRDRSRREQCIADAFPRGVRDPGFRTLLKGELYEYQCEGALFAARAETARFTDRRALLVAGLRARREQQYAAQDTFFKITNYDTVHADLDLIARWSPDLVILDEAQRIKNWNTRTARSVKRIASPYAIVLTGTPLENRLVRHRRMKTTRMIERL